MIVGEPNFVQEELLFLEGSTLLPKGELLSTDRLVLAFLYSNPIACLLRFCFIFNAFLDVFSLLGALNCKFGHLVKHLLYLSLEVHPVLSLLHLNVNAVVAVKEEFQQSKQSFEGVDWVFRLSSLGFRIFYQKIGERGKLSF